MIRNYTAHVNIGIEGRGTAILHKDCYHLTDIEKLPTGRGILGLFNDVKIISVYAPSGSARKGESEEFLNVSVPQLLRHPHPKLILARNFNCVLQPTDTTGAFNTRDLLTPWSRVLLEKLTDLQLVKKFPAFYGTRRFLTALTSSRHLSLS
jgi:exonuclease III